MTIQEIAYNDYFNRIDNRTMFVGKDYEDYIEGHDIAKEIAETEFE